MNPNRWSAQFWSFELAEWIELATYSSGYELTGALAVAKKDLRNFRRQRLVDQSGKKAKVVWTEVYG